jgi:hypothetical protein
MTEELSQYIKKEKEKVNQQKLKQLKETRYRAAKLQEEINQDKVEEDAKKIRTKYNLMEIGDQEPLPVTPPKSKKKPSKKKRKKKVLNGTKIEFEVIEMDNDYLNADNESPATMSDEELPYPGNYDDIPF